MADWKEVEVSQDAEIDAAGRGRSERVFDVWGYPKAAIRTPSTITNASGNTLPNYGTVHPDHPSHVLRRYDVSGDNILFRARALYSNDATFRLSSPPDVRQPNFQSWSLSFQIEPFPIPYLLRGTKVVSAGGITGTFRPWELRERVVPHPVCRATVRLSVQGFGPPERRLIQEQLDGLHSLPDGAASTSVWHFASADANQIEEYGISASGSIGSWELQYSWLRDPGTKAIGPPTPDPDVFYPPKAAPFGLEPPGNIMWVRPPYHGLDYVPHQTDPTQTGRFVPILLKEFLGTAWQSLPGL